MQVDIENPAHASFSDSLAVPSSANPCGAYEPPTVGTSPDWAGELTGVPDPARAASDTISSPGPTPARKLRVLFIQTDMRIGGAEMISANVIRRLDRERFEAEVCCLKDRGPLGEDLATMLPVHAGLLRHKYDWHVWPRLTKLIRERKFDAVITVGAGDKMFWGRLAARHARVPVVLSALHSTGWPDGICRLNRMLTPLTDSFIAVAESHGQFLARHLKVNRERIAVIPNGVDTERFAPFVDAPCVRRELGIDSTAPVVGIVAALRPEKNHELFLEMAARVSQQSPSARFLIIGDGPCREPLIAQARSLELLDRVLFLGSRNDVPRLLAALDVFALSSHIEANPLSILEAMSAAKPVVATNVGSIHEVLVEGRTGFLVTPGDAYQFADRVSRLLNNPLRASAMGAAGRQSVDRQWSLDATVRGYERLIEALYRQKAQQQARLKRSW